MGHSRRGFWGGRGGVKRRVSELMRHGVVL